MIYKLVAIAISTVFLLSLAAAEDTLALKGKGVFLTETNSKLVCGDKLCSEIESEESKGTVDIDESTSEDDQAEWGYRAIDLYEDVESDAPVRGGDSFGFDEEPTQTESRLEISDEIIIRPVAPTEEKDIRIYGTVDDATIPYVILSITTPTNKTIEKKLSVTDTGNFAIDVPVKSTTPLGEYNVTAAVDETIFGEISATIKERSILADVIHDDYATTNSITLSTDEVILPSSYANTQTLHITGTITDYTRGNPIVIVIAWPDGTEEELTTRATSHGFFDTFYTITPDNIEGIHDIIVIYNGSEVTRTTLTIGTSTISLE